MRQSSLLANQVAHDQSTGISRNAYAISSNLQILLLDTPTTKSFRMPSEEKMRSEDASLICMVQNQALPIELLKLPKGDFGIMKRADRTEVSRVYLANALTPEM